MQWTDAHIHVGEDNDGHTTSFETVEKQLLDTDILDRAVLFCFDEPDGIAAGNTRIKEIIDKKEHVEGLFRIDPAIHRPEDLYDRDSFAGFKMHPRSQDFSMHTVHRHMDAIADTGKPVLIHTGAWSKRAHPEEIIEAAEIHPDTTIIAAHNLKGYYFHTSQDWQERIHEADNLIIEISLTCTPNGLEHLVANLGSDRIMFASDYPYGHPVPMQHVVAIADISEEQEHDIAHRNADQLFFQD